MRSISPELVLVDPELAALARELLPDAEDCLAPRLRPEPVEVRLEPVAGLRFEPVEVLVEPQAEVLLDPLADVLLEPVPVLRAPVVEPTTPARPLAAPPPRRARRRRRAPVTLAAAWLVVAAVVASPLLAFLPPPDSQVPTLADAPPRPRPPVAVGPAAGRGGRTVPLPPSRPVQRPVRPIALQWPAESRAAYYDVILVRGHERVDLWPETNRVEVVSAAAARKADRAARDTYTWFAYPAYDGSGHVSYGRLLAHGEVTVPRGALTTDRRRAPVRGSG